MYSLGFECYIGEYTGRQRVFIAKLTRRLTVHRFAKKLGGNYCTHSLQQESVWNSKLGSEGTVGTGHCIIGPWPWIPPTGCASIRLCVSLCRPAQSDTATRGRLALLSEPAYSIHSDSNLGITSDGSRY